MTKQLCYRGVSYRPTIAATQKSQALPHAGATLSGSGMTGVALVSRRYTEVEFNADS